MITYEQYAEQFAKDNGYGGHETLFRCGLSGAELEEFTKGYAKLAIEAQLKKNAWEVCKLGASFSDNNLIELK